MALDEAQVRKVILLAIAVITILHSLRRSLRLKNILSFPGREGVTGDDILQNRWLLKSGEQV